MASTLRQGASGAEVTDLQNKLRAAGFDPGASDGRFGPKTLAAVQAFQRARGLAVDGVVGPQTWGALGGGGAAPAPAATADVLAEFKRKYPEFAYLANINDPELQALFREAAAKPGGMDSAEFQGKLFATNWWKTTPPATRTWLYQVNADPAAAEQQRAAMRARITDMGVTMGLDNGEWIGYMAEDALSKGWNDQQITDALAARIGVSTPGKAAYGTMGATIDQIKALGAQYLIGVSYQDAWNWSREILTGAQSLDGLQSMFTDQAKHLFANNKAVLDQLNQGGTLASMTSAYRQQISNLLEVAPDQVDFLNNPRFMQVLNYSGQGTGTEGSGQGASGAEVRPMTMYELGKWARSQAEWKNTDQGRGTSAQLAEKILTTMGEVQR